MQGAPTPRASSHAAVTFPNKRHAQSPFHVGDVELQHLWLCLFGDCRNCPPALSLDLCEHPKRQRRVLARIDHRSQFCMQPTGLPLVVLRDRDAMELRDLRYFAVLAEELHYRRAAKRLFITPSSLSKAVSRLEDSLGIELVERSPRHVLLTDSGAVVARKAAEIIRAVDRLHALVSPPLSADVRETR